MDLLATLEKNGHAELKAAIVAAGQKLDDWGDRWDFMLGCRFGLKERERAEPFSEAILGRENKHWRLGRDLTYGFSHQQNSSNCQNP